MKKYLRTLSLVCIATFGLSPDASAAGEKVKAGPMNGRLLTSVEPHAEFFVTPERKVEIRFVDEAGKVVAPGEREVSVTLGERSKPTKLAFTREGDKLVSGGKIPEGNNYPAVVEIRTAAGAKPVREKFNLDLSKCPTCENPEYSCVCGHTGE